MDYNRRTYRGRRYRQEEECPPQPPPAQEPEMIDWSGYEPPPRTTRTPEPPPPPELSPEEEERLRCEAERTAMEAEYDPCARVEPPPQTAQTYFDQLLPGVREQPAQVYYTVQPGKLDVFSPVPPAEPEVLQEYDPVTGAPTRTPPKSYFDELIPGLREHVPPCPTGDVAASDALDIFGSPLPSYPLCVEDYDPLWSDPATRTPQRGRQHFRDLVPEWQRYAGAVSPLLPSPGYIPDYLADLSSPTHDPPHPFPIRSWEEALEPTPYGPPVCVAPVEARPPSPAVKPPSPQPQAPAREEPRKTGRRDLMQSSIGWGEQQEESEAPAARGRQGRQYERPGREPDLIDWSTPIVPATAAAAAPRVTCVPAQEEDEWRTRRRRGHFDRVPQQRPADQPDMIEWGESEPPEAGEAAAGPCPQAQAQQQVGARKRNLMQPSINWVQEEPEFPPEDTQRKGGRRDKSPPTQQAEPQAAQRAARGRNLMQPSMNWGALEEDCPPPEPHRKGGIRDPSPPQQAQPVETVCVPAAVAAPAQAEPQTATRPPRGRNLMQTSIDWGAPAQEESPPCHRGGRRDRSSPPQQQAQPAETVCVPAAVEPQTAMRAPRGRNLMQTSIDWGAPQQEESPPRHRGGRRDRSSPPQQEEASSLGPGMRRRTYQQRQIDTNPFEKDVDPIGTGGRRKALKRDDFNQFQAVKDKENPKTIPRRRRVGPDIFNTYSVPDDELPRPAPQAQSPPRCVPVQQAAQARPPSPPCVPVQAPAPARPPSPCVPVQAATPARPPSPPCPPAVRALSPPRQAPPQAAPAQEQPAQRVTKTTKRTYVDHSRFF